jgi:hypothetical protein
MHATANQGTTPMKTPALTLPALLLACLAACGGEETAADLDMTAADFPCILDWPQTGLFRITNLLGREADAVAVAQSADGGTYPVGTVIQLIPNEAMVKRRAGWNPATSDWEYFFLDVDASGTTIVSRGGAEVVNAFGIGCHDCHSAAEPRWDLVCASNHGCEPLPFTEEQILQVQNGDPRCR